MSEIDGGIARPQDPSEKTGGNPLAARAHEIAASLGSAFKGDIFGDNAVASTGGGGASGGFPPFIGKAIDNLLGRKAILDRGNSVWTARIEDTELLVAISRQAPPDGVVRRFRWSLMRRDARLHELAKTGWLDAVIAGVSKGTYGTWDVTLNRELGGPLVFQFRNIRQ